jgi:hypothetical protein
MADHNHKYLKITVTKADGSTVTFDITDPMCEPIFLLRGQDMYAAKAVGFYGDLLEAAGLNEQAEHALEHAGDMHHWIPKKQPD